MNIADRHGKILQEILAKYPYSFYLFGSRATNKAKKFSDIDLVYLVDIPTKVLIKLEEELEESDLPYKVDLINYQACDDTFKKIIQSNYICIQEAV